MNRKNLEEFLDRQPFRPFLVHLADGRSIPVEHREFVFFPPGAQEAIIYQPDGSFQFIDLFLTTALEVKSRSETKKPRSGKSEK
jgi:hypothetical protein